MPRAHSPADTPQAQAQTTGARAFIRRLLGIDGESAGPGMAATARTPACNDTLKNSALYRLKRDSLYIVAKMNEGQGSPGLDAFKRQIVFVQSQLVLAAIRDPELSVETKAALVGFQEASLRETIEDRRGIKRRACVDIAKQAANEPRLAAM